MFKFKFSNIKTTSRDVSPYPIDLAAVKAKSFYFTDNPGDTSLDTYINDLIIPSVIKDWERQTSYILLDTTFKAFIPNIEFITSERMRMALSHLNIRSISYLKYYPTNWDRSAAKTEITEYIKTEEIKTTPSAIMLNLEIIPLNIYPIENNLEIEYSAGFSANTFTNLDPEITSCLAMQAAMAIDIKQGYCSDYYSDLIAKTYFDFTIDEEAISII